MPFKIVNLDTCFGWPEGYAQERALTSSLPVDWVMLKVVTEDEIIAASQEADVVLVERFSTQVSRRVIDALNRCRLIAKYAIGVENIDIEAATERGIVVCNAANYCLEEVSDHTVALLLACARRIVTIAPPCTAGWMARRRIPSPSASLQHLDPWAGRLWKDCTPGRSEAP